MSVKEALDIVDTYFHNISMQKPTLFGDKQYKAFEIALAVMRKAIFDDTMIDRKAEIKSIQSGF